MSSKRTLNSRYEIYGVIGVGNYGRVFEGFDTLTRSKVAIKELFPEVVRNPELMRITNMEIETLTKITHKYIIKLHDHFPIANVYYLVYDYCEKGDLKANVDRQGRFREYDALKIVYQMSEALCELKRHLIIHRDIKPENIFLTNDLCKLGDFGLCFKGDRVQLNASVGSLGFLAPETQMMLIYSSKADVYSLGICYYEMIHGDIPFTQAQIEDLYNVKMRLRIDRIPGIDISDFALNLMRRMVEPDEAKRIDCQEIRDILAPLYPEYQISPSQTGGIHQIRRVGENSERLSTQPDSTQPVSGMLQSNSLNNSYSQPATLYGVQLQQTQQYQLPSQIPASNNLYTAADHISSPFPNINLNGNSYDSSSNPVVAPAIVPQRVQPPTQIQPAPSLIGSRSMQSYKEYNRAPVYKSLIGDSPLKNRLTSISKNINNASFERESSVPRTFGTTFGNLVTENIPGRYSMGTPRGLGSFQTSTTQIEIASNLSRNNFQNSTSVLPSLNSTTQNQQPSAIAPLQVTQTYPFQAQVQSQPQQDQPQYPQVSPLQTTMTIKQPANLSQPRQPQSNWGDYPYQQAHQSYQGQLDFVHQTQSMPQTTINSPNPLLCRDSLSSPKTLSSTSNRPTVFIRSTQQKRTKSRTI